MTSYRDRHLAGHYTLGTVKTSKTDPEPESQPEPEAAADPLDEMTKAELLEHAQSLGVKPANAAMTKDELRAAVDSFLS